MLIAPLVRSIFGSRISVMNVSGFEKLGSGLLGVALTIQVFYGFPLVFKSGIVGAAWGYLVGDVLSVCVGA